MYARMVAILAVIAGVLLMFGCGDDGTSSKPVTGLEVSPDSMSVEISSEVTVTATVSGGSSKTVKWYVNGVLGGNSTFGTITQAKRATYTAPDAVPSPDRLILRCVSVEDTSKHDTCILKLQFTTVYVDGDDGNDDTGTGGMMKPFKTIAKGLEVAGEGMTVQVMCGTYYEHDLVMKSGVTLRSETGEPDCVTIDAQQQSRIFDCDDVDSTGRIIGFTVTGGYASGSGQDQCGGAMWCRTPSSVKVRNCYFSDNHAELYAGVAYCLSSTGTPKFVDCTFAGNSAATRGGAIVAGLDCTVIVKNCTFFGNWSGLYGGALYIATASGPIENTIVAFSSKGEGIYIQEAEPAPTLVCCDVFGNAGGDWVGYIAGQLGVSGNFSADPLFCDTLGGDFTLQACSPCLPANHPGPYDCGGVIGAWGEGCTCQ
jgi:predicted outer membrane repeat protein